MKLQDAFDQIYSHFNAKGAQLGRGIHNSCFYRVTQKPTGKLRCAVGVLIPDEKYRFDMESYSIADLLGQRIVDLRPTGKNILFLKEMQRTHDNADSVDDFRKRLTEHGRAYKLKIPS